MRSPDYYSLLEVPRNASVYDIQRTYRRLALKWHPDKNQDNREEAELRFKEISEAYQILSDDTSRMHYDQYGNAGSSGEQSSASIFLNPTDLFHEFFGSSDLSSDIFRDVHAISGGGGGLPGPAVVTNTFSWQPLSMAFPFGMNIEYLTVQAPVPVAWDASPADVFQLDPNNLLPPPSEPVTEVTTNRYMDCKWVETCTINTDGAATTLRFENGQFASCTVESLAHPHVNVDVEMQEDQEEPAVPEGRLPEQPGPSDDEQGSSDTS